MNQRSVTFEEAGAKTWDGWVATLPSAGCLHGAWFLRFLHDMVGSAAASFALLDDTGAPIALCPFAVTPTVLAGRPALEASWGGAPLAYPAIVARPATTRRRIARAVFEVLHERARAAGAARVVLRAHPLTRAVLDGDARPLVQMEALGFGYACLPQSTVIMDLRQDRATLEAGMTHYHRRRIRQTTRKGLAVRIYRGPGEEVAGAFAAYQAAHLAAAGRLTRPVATFDRMREALVEGHAALFVAVVNDTPASFLYCGEHDRMAYGFSQANVEEYERVYSPRHLLEWEAMCDYQARGFLYYEVGTRWYGPQLHKVPTPKELGIAEFKERYGGDLWPELWFETFFDPVLGAEELSGRLARYLEAEPFAPRAATPEPEA